MKPVLFALQAGSLGLTGAWTRMLAGNEVVGGTLEIPVAPLKGLQSQPPAQHLLFGADLGRCLAEWVTKEKP